IGGSGGKGICGGGENQGDNGDVGGEDKARSLTTSESVHAGIGTGAGMEILAVVRSSSSSSSGCISKSDSGTYSGDWAVGKASSAYGWSSATISSSACSGPEI
nr:hypothetical protein [Tanacetum cinerariifolium]